MPGWGQNQRARLQWSPGPASPTRRGSFTATSVKALPGFKSACGLHWCCLPLGPGVVMAQLVGRANEVSRALAVLRRTAQRGDGAVVLVTGEAGIGKTAFVRPVAEQAPPTPSPLAIPTPSARG